MFKSGWLFGALSVLVAACGNGSSVDNESPAGKSGLSSALVLNAATDAQKLQFCTWLVSVSPTSACGAPSASSPDGGALEATDGGASTGVAQCLATFTRFANGCTVEVTEQCFSSWEASGLCDVPVKANCAAYDACAKSAPPTNDQVGWLPETCMGPWGAGDVGSVWVETCSNVEWWMSPVYCDSESAPKQKCDATYADCKGMCTIKKSSSHR